MSKMNCPGANARGINTTFPPSETTNEDCSNSTEPLTSLASKRPFAALLTGALKSRTFLLLAVMLSVTVLNVAFASPIPAYAAEERESADTSSSGGYFAFVEADGVTKKVKVTGGSVALLLAKANIELGELDQVSLPLDTEIGEDDVVVVTRKEIRTISQTETLPFETVYTCSPDITPGTEKVIVEGRDGLRVRELRQTLINNEITQETVKSDDVQKQPVTQEVLIGFPVKPVSSLDFECTFDENYEPTEYTNVLRSQKSAGYSAPKGARTASGRKAIVGHVAVNPNVIPYGTKLFIKSSNGKHIYGYAIAADTGTALMDGRITVDLFYATYEESASNGIRDVDIFILE